MRNLEQKDTNEIRSEAPARGRTNLLQQIADGVGITAGVALAAKLVIGAVHLIGAEEMHQHPDLGNGGIREVAMLESDEDGLAELGENQMSETVITHYNQDAYDHTSLDNGSVMTHTGNMSPTFVDYSTVQLNTGFASAFSLSAMAA